jgi:phospholipase C
MLGMIGVICYLRERRLRPAAWLSLAAEWAGNGRLRAALLLLAAMAPVAACQAQSTAAPTITQAVESPPLLSPTPGPPEAHVFVIVMENKSFEAATAPGQAPATSALIAQHGLATNYHAVAHPSLPNYLALTSGDTWGITDDGYHALPAEGLGDVLTRSGVSWRAYMEGMTRGCTDSPYPYALKHNPFAYYGGRCPPNVVPLTTLDADLVQDPPRFAWITPDLCHDTHDCPVSSGDAWLKDYVGRIMASPAFQSGGVLFITWDETDGSGDRVPALVLTATGGRRSSATRYDHYSMLATVEDLLGVPRLGASRAAVAMTDLVSG